MLFGKVVTNIFVYESLKSRNGEDEDRFYDNLSAEMLSENCIAPGDFNGHV